MPDRLEVRGGRFALRRLAGLLGTALTVAGASLALIGCPRQGARAQPVSQPPSDPQSLLAVPTRDLAEVVRARYRLQPDRRLLAAAAELARLIEGHESAEPTATYQPGGWSLRIGDQQLGELPLMPGFAASTELLVRHARRLLGAAARPAAGAAGEGSSPSLEELKKSVAGLNPSGILDALAGLEPARPPALAEPVTTRTVLESLAWLATLTPDELEQADALRADAWAWLAITRARDLPEDAGSAALLARALGYEAEASTLAASLPPEDPIRLFVNGQDEALAALSARQPGDAVSYFLRLALLAERGQVRRFNETARSKRWFEIPSLSRLGLEAALRDINLGKDTGRRLAAAAFTAATTCAAGSGSGGHGAQGVVEAQTLEFEAAAARCAARLERGWLSPAAAAAVFRAAFYSGLFAEAHYALHQLASEPAAHELATRLADPAPGTAAELRRWLEVDGAVVGGSAKAAPVSEFVESTRSLGSAVLREAALAIAKHSGVEDPVRRRAMPALFARLDTRPSHRLVAARVAWRNLTSPWLFELYARAAAEAAPHLSEEMPAVAARLRGDAARLRSVADDPAMPTYARIVAVSALAKLGRTDDAFVRSFYEAVARDPDEGVSPLVEFLEDRGDLAGAFAAVAAARDSLTRPGSLEWAYLCSEAARLKLKQGDAEAAWKLVAPALATYKEDVLLEAADVQLARGLPAKALELAQASLDRYPDRSYEASALLARARWSLGDDVTAAKELAASRNGIVDPWNRFFPEAFSKAFADKPRAETEKAFAELVAAGIAPSVLAEVLVKFGKDGDLDTAMELFGRLPQIAPEWAVKTDADVYDLLRERSGEDAARTWFRAHHKRTHNDALTLYQLRRYRQILDLFPNGDEGGSPAITRVIKAACLLHLRETEGPRWRGLVEEVAGDRGRRDFFVRGARYLLDLDDESAVLEPISEDNSMASVGWAMGVKAASQRRFADADAWFQVALESGQSQQPPLAWSWTIESDWMHADRSPELLDPKAEF